MSTDFEYVLFGPKLTGKRFERFIDHVYAGNAARMKQGHEPVPCCIWGRHGIGKTQSVRDFAARKGVGFVQINPAQFEEMGDITGMPKVVDVNNTPHDPLDDVTIYIMPDWAREMHRQVLVGQTFELQRNAHAKRSGGAEIVVQFHARKDNAWNAQQLD